MKFRIRQKHMIEIIFPVALLVVFAFSALTVLLLAAQIYQSVTEKSALNDVSRTGLSYISEKIHQQDVGGQISIGELDGQEALVLTQVSEETVYHTYIYLYEGYLRELFIKDGTKADLHAGTAILEMRELFMEEVAEGLFCFTCTDAGGVQNSITVAVRSAVSEKK